MPQLLREPLVHFIAIGVILFAIDAIRADPADDEDALPSVVVTNEVLDILNISFAQEIGREPSSNELEQMVEQWIRDEALRLEAIRLQLDKNDPVVQRRLVQNMRFLLEGTDAPQEPSTEAIEGWLQEHLPDPSFRARVDLVQVFIDPARHADPGQVATELRQQLEDRVDPANLGDPFVRGRRFRNVGRAELERLFGERATDAILELPEDEWSRRIESPYGLHLIRVDRRSIPPEGGTDADREAARRALILESNRRRERDAVDAIVARTTVVRQDRLAGEAQ